MKLDIADEDGVRKRVSDSEYSALINFAAESFVDKSISDPQQFIHSNIAGTQNLLQLSREAGIPRFLQVSTDEVYGSLGDEGSFTEDSPILPNSPYSASKASADLLARAAVETYDQDVVITRCSNNYGLFQYPEKLIPLMIIKASRNEKLPVYGNGKNVRDWIHVLDHCSGILAALRLGKKGEVYNLGSDNEWENIKIVQAILAHLGKDEDLIEFVADRPGHDWRYAIDSSKAKRDLEWSATRDFNEGLRNTVSWYLENEAWWSPLLGE